MMISRPTRNMKMEIRLIVFIYPIQLFVGSLGSLFLIYRYSASLRNMPMVLELKINNKCFRDMFRMNIFAARLHKRLRQGFGDQMGD